ncbi:methyltransferase type 12 [Candidatus Vecturithrix granuli]|uniref:Methyltransferase type 12 n=1 Tax=Vecturithrix granuli TaxID=1499967 RepID=A0A081C0G5_VECG1|nr:methyltransferase type 12 [Candidatus Vecturithrix granuli]
MNHLWSIYQEQGYEAVKSQPVQTAVEAFYLAILAFGEQDIEGALTYARQVSAYKPDHPVFTQAAMYLERMLHTGKQPVYATGEGFSAFIRGGGNIPLYEHVSAALQTVYQEYDNLHLLDIGVGEGRAMLPALTPNITQLDLLEPSALMLESLCRQLDRQNIRYQAICCPVQEFIKTDSETRDLIQATFSLQSLPPQERPAVFRWLRKHSSRLIIVEFNVPEFTGMYAPEWVEYVLSHYETGLAEYSDNEAVLQGFLLPVMFGYFDRSRARTNYEQPIQTWVEECRAAGFTTITTRPLYDYWWAPAYLLDAA